MQYRLQLSPSIIFKKSINKHACRRIKQTKAVTVLRIDLYWKRCQRAAMRSCLSCKPIRYRP